MARRAYRRPVDDEDLKILMTAYTQGRTDGTFETGIERGLQQLLISPEFLFRVEVEPASAKPGTSYRVSDLELASRLSFFLWSSVPDDELLDLAARGRLRQPGVIDQQVRRMLADPRSEALTANFAGQWLQLRNLAAITPSEVLFPDFDDTLRQGFRRETELFFDSVIREDRSLISLLDADYTFLNDRLARHYGIPGIQGSHFRRVTLTDENRRGLLGQGSILTITSHPVRTSPVFRGKWILDNLLGTPPPDPPPNVPPLPEKTGAYAARMPSMRERMAQHRENTVCATCHAMIDPLGFGLERYDPVGRWRDVDENFTPIDASGVLPDGTKFNGVKELRVALAKRPDRFVSAFTEKLTTYALGRGVAPSRHAGDPQDRARQRRRRLQDLVAHPGNRQESAVSEQERIMIITKMALPRRTFLRGMGAALALPMLDAMVPALAAQSAKPKAVPRLGFYYVPNGTYLPNFHPVGVGTELRVHAGAQAARSAARMTSSSSAASRTRAPRT